MSSYLVIKQMYVKSANMHSSSLLLGGVPLMASSMFAHHLAREMNCQDEGVIYVHYDIHHLGGQAYGKFTPAQRRGAMFINRHDYVEKTINLSLQPTASAHLNCSLVIKLSASKIHIEKLKTIILRSRFAGGQIMDMLGVSIYESDDLYSALTEIKSGFIIADRQDLLKKYQQITSTNRVQAFTQLLAMKQDKLREIFVDESISWLSATTIGYALLEQPTDERLGIRQANQQDSTFHAYAEPLTGLVQYVSLRKILENDDLELEDFIWRYHWLQEDVFLLQQNFTH